MTLHLYVPVLPLLRFDSSLASPLPLYQMRPGKENSVREKRTKSKYYAIFYFALSSVRVYCYLSMNIFMEFSKKEIHSIQCFVHFCYILSARASPFDANITDRKINRFIKRYRNFHDFNWPLHFFYDQRK